MENIKRVRTRFAPSPTGYVHAGALRTALYSYLYAKQNNGDFILRIEDTDSKRTVVGSESYIWDALYWCGLMPDESPNHGANDNNKDRSYRQSQNYDYKEYALQLVEKGFAFFEDDAVRFHVPQELWVDGENRDYITVHDKLRGELKFPLSSIDNKVILKADGTPTYHLASVVDDHLMGITHVFRGDEWLPSYALHVLLYGAFNWELPEFIHLPVILNPDGKGKLSKRNAATKGFEIFPLACNTEDEKGNPVSFKGYRDLGYEPISFVNFIALLGHTFPKDVLTMQEMIDNFSIEKLHKNPAIFDLNKLNFINKGHLKDSDLLNIWEKLGKHYGVYNRDQALLILKNILPKVNVWTELPEFLFPYFNHTKTMDVSHDTLNKLSELLINANLLDIDSIRDNINSSGIDKKELREILCSSRSGSDLPFIISMLSMDTITSRLIKYY